MPEKSIPKEAAYQIVHDELLLDGLPRLNLATFVTTWMEPECDKLMAEAINKNYVDMDEYPVTTELQVRLREVEGVYVYMCMCVFAYNGIKQCSYFFCSFLFQESVREHDCKTFQCSIS